MSERLVGSDGMQHRSDFRGIPENQSDTWAWVVALAPLVWGAALVWWTIAAPRTGWVVTFAMAASVVASAVATRHDVRGLTNHRAATQRGFPAAVLLLYPIAAPAYLIYRTRKAGTSARVPVAWFVCMAISVVSVAFVPASDVKRVELDLAQELSDVPSRPMRVDCPNDADYSAGSKVVCDVDNHGDPPHEVVVEMRADGHFTWEVQQP